MSPDSAGQTTVCDSLSTDVTLQGFALVSSELRSFGLATLHLGLSVKKSRALQT